MSVYVCLFVCWWGRGGGGGGGGVAGCFLFCHKICEKPENDAKDVIFQWIKTLMRTTV